MGPHYLVAYAAAAVALFHSLLSITRAPMPVLAEAGLWAGSLAAVAVVAQVLLGRDLRGEQGDRRRRARTVHFCVMLTLVLLVAVHVLLVLVH
jgi:thiosulfate reductase cytochrome b subunit